MRVTIYDRNPGPGVGQWFLSLSWVLGCFIQKLFGAVDKYYGAKSWEDAYKWLGEQGQLSSVQYWGHGSPGTVWLAGRQISTDEFIAALKSKVSPESIIWFRTCSTFQGAAGYRFSAKLCDELNCVVAGHTRIIGLLQGGLHTRRPLQAPSWPIDEAELPKAQWPYLKSGNNTISCFATKIPKGW
jgi:hypothetical protein